MPRPTLSDREITLLLLLRDGKTTAEMSQETGRSVGAIGVAFTMINHKLGTCGRVDSLAQAIKRGYLPGPPMVTPLPTHDGDVHHAMSGWAEDSIRRRVKQLEQGMHFYRTLARRALYGHDWARYATTGPFTCTICHTPTNNPLTVTLPCASVQASGGYGRLRRVPATE